jgi:hypothetical protein
MKRTLVIHPKDRSTDFLKPIYENIADKTVVMGGVSISELHKLIDEHERIIMMGHGCPDGLFSLGLFPNSYGLAISSDTVFLLENKECIFIWCNADQFVKRHGLKGFYSGMFISEVGESYYCGIPTNQSVVTESNDTFANILKEEINQPLNVIHERVTLLYNELAHTNPVAKYNNERIYLS